MGFNSRDTGYNYTVYTKADVTATPGAWTTANSPITIFTVTGAVLCTFYAYSTAAMTSTGATGTISLGYTGQTAAFLGVTTINATNFPTAGGEAWVSTDGSLKAKLLASTDTRNILVGSTNVLLTIATNNMTAGGMVIVCEWTPISAGATVV